MEQTLYQIYDKAFKKILTLSSTAIVNLINGLFNTDYPTDSIITYNWTEFEDNGLKRTLADAIITVNYTNSYHMEAQMTKDDFIVFRMFEYGFGHADRNKPTNEHTLVFPEPIIIYLYYEGEVPDEYTLTLDFGTQGTFDYKVKTFKFLDTSVDELNRTNMVALIPFSLLKLRKLLSGERTDENLNLLKRLIQCDIIESIETNLRVGNITMDDARRLKRLTHKLYEHIYSHYEEMEDLNAMTDESLMLDIDILEMEFDKKLEEKEKLLEEKEKSIAEMDKSIAEKDKSIAEMDKSIAEKDKSIAEKNKFLEEKDLSIAALTSEIELLKEKLKELSK